MSRSGQVPIRMRVEGMRLVPASAFDQEALSAYQNGAVIQVSFWQGRNPDLLRKFWAILSKVVETCNTPWEDKEEAADALKLALGITDVGSTVNGQMFVRPGSIAFNALDEARFRKFFEDSMAILCRITGVDVEELGREAADTGPDHDSETGEIITNTPSADAPPAPASSADAGMTPVDEAGADDSPASDAPASTIPDDVRKHFIDFARKALTTASDTQLGVAQRMQAIDNMELDYRDVVPESFWKQLGGLKIPAQYVISGDRTVDRARNYIAKDLLDCNISDLGGVDG
ncbi:DUF1367 family protein [Agrobacterium tumefaciens]|uniref:DUF1367 family protein n=1 Tax=Agrobacterium tumefaciens TaxID=358 RepID=UPI001CBF66F6|nr:DUF1367 family protein [Agrobacterium tumefaciens]